VYFGWVLFALAISALLWFSLRFADPVAVDARSPPSNTGRTAAQAPLIILCGVAMLALTALPSRIEVSAAWWLIPAAVLFAWGFSSKRLLPRSLRVEVPRDATWHGQAILVSVSALALLAGGPLLLSRAAGAAAEGHAISLPVVDGCERAANWSGAWQPAWAEPDFDATGSYRCGGDPVDVSVAGYRDSSQGKDLVAVDNRLYPEQWRQFLQRGTHQVDETIAVQELRLEKGYERSVIWSWYVVGHRPVTTPIGVKLLQVLEVLKGNGAGGRIYWLETPMEPDLESARIRLEHFVGALGAGRATNDEARP
jgi:EpsI family protein